MCNCTLATESNTESGFPKDLPSQIFLVPAESLLINSCQSLHQQRELSMQIYFTAAYIILVQFSETWGDFFLSPVSNNKEKEYPTSNCELFIAFTCIIKKQPTNR